MKKSILSNIFPAAVFVGGLLAPSNLTFAVDPGNTPVSGLLGELIQKHGLDGRPSTDDRKPRPSSDLERPIAELSPVARFLKLEFQGRNNPLGGPGSNKPGIVDLYPSDPPEKIDSVIAKMEALLMADCSPKRGLSKKFLRHQAHLKKSMSHKGLIDEIHGLLGDGGNDSAPMRRLALMSFLMREYGARQQPVLDSLGRELSAMDLFAANFDENFVGPALYDPELRERVGERAFEKYEALAEEMPLSAKTFGDVSESGVRPIGAGERSRAVALQKMFRKASMLGCSEITGGTALEFHRYFSDFMAKTQWTQQNRVEILEAILGSEEPKPEAPAHFLEHEHLNLKSIPHLKQTIRKFEKNPDPIREMMERIEGNGIERIKRGVLDMIQGESIQKKF